MGKEYNISKTSGACCECGKAIGPGEQVVATVHELEEDFERRDFCPACWDAREQTDTGEGLIGVWRTVIPRPQEKRKLLVDDEVLVSFFERLAEAQEPAKVNFRYVLGLILMRKRLLVYDRMTQRDDGRDEWQMHLRGSDRVHKVIDPHMDPEEIAEVSRHVGEILETEL